METKNKRVIDSWWIFTLVVILGTICKGCVEGLLTLDKNKFGPKPKGTIKTIEVPEDGDMIDCVDIYKQPAFDDPLINDFEMVPSSSYLSLFNKTIEPRPKLIQNWHKYGECPEGTIPIRRTWNNNGTVYRKTPNYDPPKTREYALAHESGSIYHGASAVFNLWNPQVRGPNELSLSQMWLASGHDPDPINTVEAGWMVYPELYHDSQTRLFTYWTGDSYDKTGCYNLDCAGFVQTNREIVLGGALEPISVYGGQSYDIDIDITRDRETNRWWLRVGSTKLGYFHPSRITGLQKGANLKVEFGGEIVNHKSGNRHTATQMGSGHFPSEGFTKANYIHSMSVVNNKYKVVDASVFSFASRPTCYNVKFGLPETTWKQHFYFGGPGYSRRCQ